TEAAPATQPACADRVQGKVVLYSQPQEKVSREKGVVIGQQQLRLKRAIDRTLEELSALTTLAEAKFSADIAAIFSGHHTLLDDPDLYAAACDRVRDEQCSAEWAWHQVLNDLSQQYRHLDDPYLQARYIDIEDILHRTLRHLNGSNEVLPQFDGPSILVADDIFPSTVLQLDADRVKGICLQAGSELSHGAIIARQAGIAMLCQQSDVLTTLQKGETVILDIPGKRVIRA
ncbi:phosphoenolpyruvate-utilizing N-terminal domain-containing protein, partial [Klebsiella oxytoca]